MSNFYENLMSLVEKSEAFYYKDFPKDDRVYRIFNYRLASYTEFLAPDAMECRGHMFDVTDEPFIVSRPMEKFFNLYENPMTMDLDLTTVTDVEMKADGSLISTYLHNNKLHLKTKGSLESDQAIAAMAFLDLPENTIFKEELTIIALLDNTVNMEWCAPDNRVVISYPTAHLTVLNIRCNRNGVYLNKEILREHTDPVFNETLKRWTASFIIDPVEYHSIIEFVADIPNKEGIEGFVVRLESGLRVKIKTEWYLVQHRAKDSINSPRRLFEACIEEATDDLRSLFHDDPVVIAMITEMETFAEGIYNHTVDQVERFYERNKGLERKEYAILGQKELDKKIFGLAMSKYLERPVDYKAFLRKHYKSFGVAADPVNDVE